MPIFRYEATEATGRILRGAMDAASPQEVQDRLRAKGYARVEIHSPALAPPATLAPPELGAGGAASVASAAKAEDLALFCRQMAALLKAGMTPGAALANLAPRTANPTLQAAGLAMGQQVSSGASLAGELARTGGLFPEHVVGLIAAGEVGGFLPFAFEEAALGAEQDAALRQGLWWVRLLIWQSLWSIWLFPPTLLLQASAHFDDVKTPVLAYLRWEALFWIPFGIALHLVAHFGGKWWSTPAAAPFRDKASLRIPVMAHLHKTRALASFTRVLSKLLSSGVAPTVAYEAAARAVPNSFFRERLLLGVPVVRSAGGIDQAIQATGMMDFDPVQLLITGQHSGQLTEMLDQVTAFYQEEAARATEKARKEQKRWAVLITLVSTGYITILALYGGVKLMRGFLSTFEQP